ncbi:DMT family transporter [Nisaea sediminum]|uniref:DMT family transporter n=1 Tax=Nisaea sediminum TaxID=2775867 RepID=UPI001868D954|nr:DMT family transporter [Nisaea sediminum]
MKTGALSNNLQGALWILASCLAATVMTVGVKISSDGLASTQIVFVRCVLSLAMTIPFLIGSGKRVLFSRRWKMHLLRGAIGAISMNAGFYALGALPITTASVLFFSTPLFMTALAGPMLGEKVGIHRWGATLVGFAGIVVVVDPGLEGLQFAMLSALVSAALFAVMLIQGKTLSKDDPPGTLMVYFMVISTLASMPPALSHWEWPDTDLWIVLVVLSVGATARVYFDIKAYAVGEASAISVFQYLRLITIAFAGYLVFAEIPDERTIVGAGLIVASTLYIAQREALRQRRARAEAQAAESAD